MQRRAAAKKYWETHDYDPFTCTYYDEDKEAAFQALKAAAMEEQPMKQDGGDALTLTRTLTLPRTEEML